jgi:hypothetical protein
MGGIAGLSLARGAWPAGPEDTGVSTVSEENVLELRQYTLRGGKRDVLISLFERNFIDPQNALGAHVLGIFRDLDDLDRFVWVRGFRDMTVRQSSLSAFYGGPEWLANKAAANATMIDSDNVLLLRPAAPGTGFPERLPNAAASGGVIGATIYYLRGVDSAQFARLFDEVMLPQVRAAGTQPLARFVSEETPNNFPRLPIRDHDRVFVWFAQWSSIGAEDAFVAKLRGLSGWRDSVPDAVLPALMEKPERLRLAPTPRSVLR